MFSRYNQILLNNFSFRLCAGFCFHTLTMT